MIRVLGRGRRLRRRLLVVGGLAALLAAAGALALATGKEETVSKAEYEQSVRAAYADVQAAFRRTRGASGLELAGRVAEAQEALREAADKLAGVEPPPAVAAAHDQLVAGLREYADDLEELRAAAATQDVEAIERFNARLPENDAVQKISQAAEEMTEQGYDLGPIAEE